MGAESGFIHIHHMQWPGGQWPVMHRSIQAQVAPPDSQKQSLSTQSCTVWAVDHSPLGTMLGVPGDSFGEHPTRPDLSSGWAPPQPCLTCPSASTLFPAFCRGSKAGEEYGDQPDAAREPLMHGMFPAPLYPIHSLRGATRGLFLHCIYGRTLLCSLKPPLGDSHTWCLQAHGK